MAVSDTAGSRKRKKGRDRSRRLRRGSRQKQWPPKSGCRVLELSAPTGPVVCPSTTCAILAHLGNDRDHTSASTTWHPTVSVSICFSRTQARNPQNPPAVSSCDTTSPLCSPAASSGKQTPERSQLCPPAATPKGDQRGEHVKSHLLRYLSDTLNRMR